MLRVKKRRLRRIFVHSLEMRRAGVEEGEKQLISRVFKLGDKPVASLMTSAG
jgi:CBS domain containing-hemolysin-like protein